MVCARRGHPRAILDASGDVRGRTPRPTGESDESRGISTSFRCLWIDMTRSFVYRSLWPALILPFRIGSPSHSSPGYCPGSSQMGHSHLSYPCLHWHAGFHVNGNSSLFSGWKHLDYKHLSRHVFMWWVGGVCL